MKTNKSQMTDEQKRNLRNAKARYRREWPDARFQVNSHGAWSFSLDVFSEARKAAGGLEHIATFGLGIE